MSETPHSLCLSCASPRLGKLGGYEHAHLVRCENCALVFAGLRPSVERLREYYSHYPVMDELSSLTRRRYDELLDQLERYRQLNAFLDVGAGSGWFIAAAGERGWDVHATEYGDHLRERLRARGIAATRSLLDDHSDGGSSSSFDVVTAHEVVEHMVDPLSELRLMAKLLRPGGVAYLTTPNFASLSRRVLRERWQLITYPEHLVYFTPRTLTRMARRAGLEPVELRTTGISPSQLRRGLRHGDAKPPEGTACADESVRELLESGRALRFAKAAANRALSVTAMGDTIKALYRRPGGPG